MSENDKTSKEETTATAPAPQDKPVDEPTPKSEANGVKEGDSQDGKTPENTADSKEEVVTAAATEAEDVAMKEEDNDDQKEENEKDIADAKVEAEAEAEAEAKTETETETETEPTTPTPRKRGRGPSKKTMGLDNTDINDQTLTLGRRERKTPTRHDADLVVTLKKDFVIKPGRGKRLDSFPRIKANVNALKNSDPILLLAQRITFPMRGKPVVKKIKGYLLEFSGYLPAEKDAEADQAIEIKMSQKAYKLTIANLKSLCELFDINVKAFDKDTLVDNLLDFLGSPNEKLTKEKTPTPRKRGRPRKSDTTAPTPASPSKKAKTKKTKTNEEDDESFGAMEFNKADVMDGDGTEPSERKLKQWVQAYVTCFNLDKASVKHAIETASDKFGVDMSAHKGKIKGFLHDIIAS